MGLATTAEAGRVALIRRQNGGTKHNYYIPIDIMVIVRSEVNSEF
jgi:hypothetical protein